MQGRLTAHPDARIQPGATKKRPASHGLSATRRHASSGVSPHWTCLKYEWQNPAASSLEPSEVQEQGLLLRFRPTRIDRHGDVFGCATLRVPHRGRSRHARGAGGATVRMVDRA
mgnify:CR=1 FL=1